MIKLIFFDFSRTIAKGSGFRAGSELVNKKDQYDKIYDEFKSHKIKDEDYVKFAVKLWKGIKQDNLPEIYSKIKISHNVKPVLKELKKMKLKLALVSNIPLLIAELYKTNLGFDYISGTDCEVKNGAFTGNAKKINSDKMAVIKNICDKTKIKPSESIAIGDSISDIKMFKAVGYENSIAYNASEDAKQYAKYHIKDFKEIIKIIEQKNDITIKNI